MAERGEQPIKISPAQVSDGDQEPLVAAGVTHLCGNAAGVRDAARQRASCGAVVVHVDGPVGVLLTAAALILPQGETTCQVRDVMMRGLDLHARDNVGKKVKKKKEIT